MIHTVDGRNSANQLIWRISIFRVIGFRIITPGAGFLPSTVGRIATSASIGHLDVLYEDEMRICIESRAWVSHLSSSGEPEESRSRTSTSPLLILLARNIHLSGGFISTKKKPFGEDSHFDLRIFALGFFASPRRAKKKHDFKYSHYL